MFCLRQNLKVDSSYNLSCEFDRLTRIIFLDFFLIFFLILLFNTRLIEDLDFTIYFDLLFMRGYHSLMT